MNKEKGRILSMSRRKLREQAFIFLFESTFGLQSLNEIITNAELVRDEKIDSFTRELFEGTLEKQNLVDEYIEKNSNGWDKNRLSRTALSILRLAIFEMMFVKDIPVSVSINEAVELAKKYSTKQEASYINGVLGSVSKSIEK